MLRGIGVLPEVDPNDLKRYSYLHFPINLADIFKRPRVYFNMYGKFFLQRIIHHMTSSNGVSKQDRWVCDTIEKSLAYHETLSNKIEAETGDKTFVRQSRIYWSPNLKAMEKKEKIWKELGIQCEYMHEREIMERTLLKANSKLYVLKIKGDGKILS